MIGPVNPSKTASGLIMVNVLFVGITFFLQIYL
jgi:hypothetical protein